MIDKVTAFMRRVEKLDEVNGCWVWTGARTRADYGRIHHQYAHRLSYEMHVGVIPAGHEVRHQCDRPWCVNPAHLLTGTHAENMRDMADRGRGATRPSPGSSHPMAKLTDEQVMEIRRRAAAGENQHDLAAEFGVKNSNISMIHRRATWRHL